MTDGERLGGDEFERWLRHHRCSPGGQRLGQAFLNSRLCEPMRRRGRIDPALFYDEDEARTLGRIEAGYIGRLPEEQGEPSEEAYSGPAM